MTVSMDTIEKAIDVCRSLKEESKTWKGTAILGVHAEGPFINPKKKGAQDEKYILKPRRGVCQEERRYDQDYYDGAGDGRGFRRHP